MNTRRTVSITTLGCARNLVDSEELAQKLSEAGWHIAEAGEEADAALVNTCGFISAAKQESIETILSEGESGHHRPPVIAVGCLAERYGAGLADALPEASAVVGFDGYDGIAGILERVVAGEDVRARAPYDRRKLLPVSPVLRQVRGAGSDRDAQSFRRRLDAGPMSPLRIASGCDRRCAFCAIPAFRGAFRSRPISEIVSEAMWLTGQGVRELHLVGENTTSFGKDIPGAGLAELLRALDSALTEGCDEPVRIRLSYLQPAEMRPGLVDVIAELASVAPYFDLSFQHADRALLRRMRRHGSAEVFLSLVGEIRSCIPDAGIRSNFIVGFPGETLEAFEVLEQFVACADLDAVGVFAYSDEDGTSAYAMDAKIPESEIRARADRLAGVADAASSARAAEREGDRVEVLIEDARQQVVVVGRAAHQGPADGETRVSLGAPVRRGAFVSARVTSTDGVDLIATEEP